LHFFLFQNGEFVCMPARISVWHFLPFRVMPLTIYMCIGQSLQRLCCIAFMI